MISKHLLMVIAPSDFRDEEFFEPYQHFTETQNWLVTVASTQAGVAKGMLGKSWPVEEVIANQQAENFDALVIVGGMGSPTFLWDNEDLKNLARDFHRLEKVVASICLSGVVLARAGILEGRNATVWEMPESLAEFQLSHARYLKQDVVTDGPIITANGPHAALAFATEISRHLTAVPAQ